MGFAHCGQLFVSDPDTGLPCGNIFRPLTQSVSPAVYIHRTCLLLPDALDDELEHILQCYPTARRLSRPLAMLSHRWGARACESRVIAP